MKRVYMGHLTTGSRILNDSDKVTYLTSVLRSLLQVVSITSIEIINKLTPNDEIDLQALINRLQQPSDGLPIEIIDAVVPFLRTYTHKDFMLGWYEPLKKDISPINKDLISWVEFRNSRTGHGVLDIGSAKLWAEKTFQLIEICLKVFSLVLPTFDNNQLKLGSNFKNIEISTPLHRDGEAIVVTSIKVNKGLWKLNGQILSRESADKFSVNLSENNIFTGQNNFRQDTYKLAEISSNGNDHSFFHNLPIRQTDAFEGRKKELAALEEWVEDEDTRYCLVYGDGGYGKTTLVLEFLNRFADDQLDLKENIPSIVSYHTAKMTKWTDTGLTHFKGISLAMAENIRELMRLFNPVLGREWYTISNRQLIDKAAGVLAENKYTRDEVLLVFDNTETLATSTRESEELGAFFKMVGKKIARVIITSRRREFIQAEPIRVKELSIIESVSLMRKLAEEYNAAPILQAGETRLRKVCKQLMYKPLLIDVLVKYISSSKLSIENSLNKIFKKSNNELLQFLYEDAWSRMNELQKQVFLILVKITSPIDQLSIGQTCQAVGIQQTEFQLALDETYFSSQIDYGSSYSIEIVELAKRFFEQEYGKLCEEDKNKVNTLSNSIDKYITQREKIERDYKLDRVAEAFRSEYAKAAKNYVDKNKINDAIEMYELAIKDDPCNSALFDRFSWLLFNRKQNYEYAKRMSKKSIELNPKNYDAIVNLALIYYREGKISEGDRYIDKVKGNGRTIAFCLLRKSIARYHRAKDMSENINSLKTLEAAEILLHSSMKANDSKDKYYQKNKQSMEKYLWLIKRELQIRRSKETKLNKLT